MKTRYLIAVCAVPLVVCGVILAQQPVTPPPGVTPNLSLTSPAGYPQPVPPTGGFTYEFKRDNIAVPPVPPPPKAETKPDEMTIEQLAEALKNLRAERAEMDAREKAMVKALRKKGETLRQLIDSVIGDTGPSGAVVPGSNGIHGGAAPVTHPTLPTAPTSP